MGFSLLPKEFQFFGLLDKQAALTVEAAGVFKGAAKDKNFDHETVQRIHFLENACDEVTHEIIDKLNRTFITPFDREDIHALAHEQDNVLDMIQAMANRIHIYKVNVSNKDLFKFAELIEKSAQTLADAVKGLRTIKKTKPIVMACIEVNKLENLGDQLRDIVIGKLFESGKDAAYMIKWKDIFQDAETALDKCEDVANIIQTIVVKHT